MKNSALSGRFLISDAFGKAIEPIIRAVKGTTTAPSKLSPRMFVEAILYIARTGNPWRDMPRELAVGMPLTTAFAVGKNQALGNELGSVSKALTTSQCAIFSSIPPPCERISMHLMRLQERRRPTKASDGKILRRPDHQTACRLRR